MITLKFLGTWLKITGVAVLAAIFTGILVHSPGWRTVVTIVIALVYFGLTAALWREWAAFRRGDGGYSYQYIRYGRDE
ncbi:hypothetical protein [Amycolatopsis sp. cg9]|uniref:hypothetical protein n=1 Tax=Amycolatopsis sp. cg9 TaxID=3238801 RepID=UPI003523F9D4